MALQSDYLGKGILFPLSINNKGNIDIINTTELIRNNITHILSWPQGTRYFQREFGSRLDLLIEEQDTTVMISLVKTFIRESLYTYEKRIELLEIKTKESYTGRIDVELIYKVKATQTTDSFIYPFYQTIKF